MELKHLNYNDTEFEANGTKYYVKSSLSVERYRWFEKYQVMLGFGYDFKSIWDAMDKSVALANKGKGLEAWNIIFNLREGVGKKLEERVHPAMLICALFLVHETEDLTKWDEQLAQKKIDDWNAEGYDVNDFFRLAANLVSGYIEALEGIFQNTSEMAAKVNTLNDMIDSSST